MKCHVSCIAFCLTTITIFISFTHLYAVYALPAHLYIILTLHPLFAHYHMCYVNVYDVFDLTFCF